MNRIADVLFAHRVILTIVSLALTCIVPASATQDPLDLIPAESLITWRGRPMPETASGPSSQPSAIGTLLDMGTRIAGSPLKPRDQFGVRLLEAFGLAVHYPFAIALIDAQARPTETGEGRRVDKLRIALVIRTENKAEPFRKIIQKTVNELTDRGKARLTQRSASDFRFDELRDERLEEAVAWGEIGDSFVITYGPDVWPLIASVAAKETESIASQTWIHEARASLKTPPLIEIVVAAERAKDRLDPFVEGRASAFFAAWHADKLERAHWALGFEGRALYCIATFRIANATVRRVYADPAIRDPRWLDTVPESSRYAIYRIPVSNMLPRVFSGYYATQDARDRQSAWEEFQRIQRKLGIEVEKDLLSTLGDTIILHNDPPHPLRLPLAFTSLIEIRHDPQKLRDLGEKVCTAWSEWLETADERDASRWARLERADDGIWHFQYGPIAGLAWTITDRFLITSWSPNALREYLQKVGSKVGTPAP